MAECDDLSMDDQHKVNKCITWMEELDFEIARIEEEEMSLTDLENNHSAFIKLNAFSKKFKEVWSKFCKITKQSPNVWTKFIYTGTQYDVLNRKVQKYIRKFECCPDFQDILELVRKCNTKYLDNDIRKQDEISLARQIFVEVISKIQKERVERTEHILGFDRYVFDPADEDSELREKLSKNRDVAKANLAKVFEKFENFEKNDASKMTADESEIEQGTMESDTNSTTTDVIVISSESESESVIVID